MATSLKGKRLNWIQHLLQRPDTKIGSIKTAEAEKWIYDDETKRIVYKTMQANNALEQIFVEALSNAIDNKWRSEEAKIQMTTIKVDITPTSVQVWNDGVWIPNVNQEWAYTDPETNRETKMTAYPAEIYFGYDLSGTNYDDEHERKTSGRNGIGIKTTNVFSKMFQVVCADPASHRHMTFVFENNLSVRHAPVMKRHARTVGYTQVSFTPDFERFGMEQFDADWIGLFKFHAWNSAMSTGLKVVFNGELLKVPNLAEYAKLFSKEKSPKLVAVYHDLCEVVLMEQSIEDAKEYGFRHVAFTNGAMNKDGGVHVDAWRNKLIDQLRDGYNEKKKEKKEQASRKDVDPYFMLFIKYEPDKPEFDNQYKHRLSFPKPKVKALDASTIKGMMKWDFAQRIQEMLDARIDGQIRKIERQRGLTLGSKGEDANWAGTKKWRECGLIITEGGSAMSSAIAGISILPDGKNIFGLISLRGKLVNASKTTAALLNTNKEIMFIKKMIGLERGRDYALDENFESLRYGCVYLFCDADVDGAHIEGLVSNYFYREYPGLAIRGFIRAIRTPVVKVEYKGKTLEFYREEDYKEWNKTTNIRGKYYKGLATLTGREIKQYFKSFKYVKYTFDGASKKMMDLAFSQTAANERKQWITEYDPEIEYLYPDGTVSKYHEVVDGDMMIDDFINHRLILYALESIQRAIPSILDGFKEAQRKALYGMCKRANTTLKIERLAGYIGDHTNYHHGEVSMQNTLAKMAQGFVGAASNNLPLLMNIGMFGTRLGKEDVSGKIKGGEDAGAARYIETRLDECARLLFRPEDDELLQHNVDDGVEVEPIHYVPILPFLLINGADGIAMGWSSKFPKYNPIDLKRWVDAWIKGRIGVSEEFPELTPWYRNFTGEIEKISSKKYISRGIITKGEKDREWKVSELPIGVWTNSFKVFLEGMREKGFLKFTNNSTESKVNFTIITDKNFIPNIKRNFKILESTILLSNMVALDSKGLPHKYENVEEIMEEFCTERLALYQVRLENEMTKAITLLKIAENRLRFIKAVLDKSLIIFNRDEGELFIEMEEKEYDKHENKYDYLVNMPIRSMTKQKLALLEKEITKHKKRVVELEATTPEKMWLEELDEFEAGYKKFLKRRED